MPPLITSVSGTLTDGSVLTISGSNFGTKSTAQPQIWAPMTSNINPSALGVVTSWDAGHMGNVEWSSDDGGSVRSTPLGQTSAEIGAYKAATWVQGGGRIYIYQRVKMNFLISDPSQNWKIIRTGSEPNGGSYPDMYMSDGNGNVATEGGDHSLWYGDLEPLSTVRLPDTTNYHTREFVMQMNSTSSQVDGIWRFYLNGRKGRTSLSGIEREDLGYNSVSYPNWYSIYYLMHHGAANTLAWNPAWSSNNRSWFKDLYFDTSWSRVIVGTASTYAACTDPTPMIPATWSATSITATAYATGAVGALANKYLYVFDSAGNVNASGFRLTGSAPVTQTLVGGYRIS